MITDLFDTEYQEFTAFRDWMRFHLDGSWYVNNAYCCPLASWVKTLYPNKHVSIGRHEVMINGTLKKLPEWAMMFIKLVDGAVETVPARDCIVFLKVVEPVQKAIEDLLDWD